jgi:hypothetical protein
VGYLVDSGCMMTVGGCGRRWSLVQVDWMFDMTRLALNSCILVHLNCLLVDRMQEEPLLSIHRDVAHSHCSRSYFATRSLISKS